MISSERHALKLDHVSLALGGRTILADISLGIEAGQFVGVLGANGAGKTTLLRALLGLITPSAGQIEVLGQPVQRGNPAIGYIPQFRSNNSSTRLRGWEFVASAVHGHRWGLPIMGREDRRIVDAALALVGATQLAQRPLTELSGGERQRLLMAQAMLGQPRLLLLDEPLISLDPSHQHGVVALVKQIQQELKVTVLFCAHELNPLLSAMDRVLYLGQGQAALGTVDEVITAPVLSRLYGSPIEVIKIRERIFVMAGEVDLEHDEHRHEGHHHHV